MSRGPIYSATFKDDVPGDGFLVVSDSCRVNERTDLMPNKELLLKTLNYIKEHPESWDQEIWRNDCGTAMCFAGWACQLDGGKWVNGQSDRLIPEPEEGTVFTIDAGARAERILGLTTAQADELFDACNTLEDLEQIVTALIGEVEPDDDPVEDRELVPA